MAIAKAGTTTTFRLHVYPDHVFTVVHAPEIGAGGHVHYLELDQFVGENFPSPYTDPSAQRCRSRQPCARPAPSPLGWSGRLHPASPFGLSYAIVSSIARREADMVAEIAREVGLMEQRVMAEADEDPHKFLSELFSLGMNCWRSRPWPSRAARSIDGQSS